MLNYFNMLIIINDGSSIRMSGDFGSRKVVKGKETIIKEKGFLRNIFGLPVPSSIGD